ncbi:hypothetical protein TURU_024472 [Turdus rufiventris]|nr:hypothetical protein TURU_024472 [Turdus rufiventris]
MSPLTPCPQPRAAVTLLRPSPEPCATMTPLRPCPQPCLHHEPAEALPSALPSPGPGLSAGSLPHHLWMGLVTTSGCAPLPPVGTVGQVSYAVPAMSLKEPLVLRVSPQPRLRWNSPWEEVGEAQVSAMRQGPLKWPYGVALTVSILLLGNGGADTWTGFPQGHTKKESEKEASSP